MIIFHFISFDEYYTVLLPSKTFDHIILVILVLFYIYLYLLVKICCHHHIPLLRAALLHLLRSTSVALVQQMLHCLQGLSNLSVRLNLQRLLADFPTLALALFRVTHFCHDRHVPFGSCSSWIWIASLLVELSHSLHSQALQL